MSSVGVQLRIQGLVQRVGYRYYCYRAARSLGLNGWVKNSPDGSVSVVAEGDRSLLEEFIKELKAGPFNASVTAIDITWTDYTGHYTKFDISM